MAQLSGVGFFDCGGRHLSARSVSWNVDGSLLAVASSDCMVRISTVDGISTQMSTVGGTAANPATARDVLAVSGHAKPVDIVRFHPKKNSLVCSAASDQTVRLWDVRDAKQKAIGQINIKSGSAANDITWSNSNVPADMICVVERDGSVYLYDSRKLAPSTMRFGQSKSYDAAHTFRLKPCAVEKCVFSPLGNHLVAATTHHGQGDINIWEWKTGDVQPNRTVFPAHTAPIYSLAFSPDGTRFATGGGDAIVGLWNAASIVCTHTITRHLKFLRGVAFSHDGKFVASSNEEDSIDLATADNGQSVGKISLGRLSSRGGSDEIQFHPKSYLLACARSSGMASSVTPPVTIAKLSITNN